MPDGFIGNACSKYLNVVENAMTESRNDHNKNPFADLPKSDTPPPQLKDKQNFFIKHEPESSLTGGYSTNYGNENNIVLDREVYSEIIYMLKKTDTQTVEDLHNIVTQIEQMCETIYIVPSVLPKLLEIVKNIKESLSEYRDLGESTEQIADDFCNEIVSIDDSFRVKE